MDKLRIVSASHDRTIKIWEREPSSGTSTSKCLHTLVGHRGAVISVRMTDDRIISGLHPFALLSLSPLRQWLMLQLLYIQAQTMETFACGHSTRPK